MDLKEKIRNWYEGRYIPYENDPNSSVVIVGGYYERHWTAKFARILVSFYLEHWKWLWGVFLSLLGLYMAYLKLQ